MLIRPKHTCTEATQLLELLQWLYGELDGADGPIQYVLAVGNSELEVAGPVSRLPCLAVTNTIMMVPI